MPSPAVASRARRNGTAGRIAHVTIIHPPTDARIFERQCRSLAALGHEVHLLAPGAGQRQQDGVRLHALTPTWERPHLRQQVPLQLRTWRQAWRLDAGTYHLHDPHLIPLGVALSLRGARVIYDVHEDYPRRARSKLAGRPVRAHLKAALWTALEAVARRRLDGFVCASETIARRFAGDVAVVHNHPRSGDYPDPGALPYAQRPATVVFVGLQRRQRGLREAVRAMALLNGEHDCRLRLVGRVDPPALLAEAARDPGWRRVDLVPWLPRPGVVRELGRARVGLVALHRRPNQESCMGSNKLFEYMASGLPVIVSDAPGWRWLTDELGCGLAVDPLDPGSIAAAIDHLLCNPEEAEEMGRRGRRAVERRFNWEGEAGKLIGLYRRLGVPPTSAGVV